MSALAFNNPKVQQLRRLIGRRSSRYDDRRFVVEGPVSVTQAVDAGWGFDAQFVPIGSDAAIVGAGAVFELAEGVFERVAPTQVPQAPLAICRMGDRDPLAVLASAEWVVALHEIRDPGNLGTIIRSAEAAGAGAVVLTPGSVDHFSPKVVRASAGALFHLAVIVAELDDIVTADLELVGTSSHISQGRTVEPYFASDLTGRVALVMGSEAAGLPQSWSDAVGPVRRWVTIPHRGRSESLNVAMAATVLVFEVARQRSNGS